MIEVKKSAYICCAMLLFFACTKPAQNIPSFTVSKEFKSDSVTILNVHINSRMAAGELLLIAGKVKADSVQIQHLAIHYLLPGNAEMTAGDHSYYASAAFITAGEVKAADTLKDDKGNVCRIKMYGLSRAQARYLLGLQSKEIAGKNVLGRFIDDNDHTVIIPFTDKQDKKNDLYIIELDSTAKVVSATVPQKVNNGGMEKWLVTQNGDYIILKDSILGQYAGNGFGVPFNSIKSGI